MNFNIDRLTRQKEELDNLIRTYKNVNNAQMSNVDLVEMRILNENEEVDNLYVQNKTLFISDNLMILKCVDGRLEKWEIKKIYPIDKKDEKIKELELEIIKLKEMMNNEHTKSNEPDAEFKQPDGDADEYVKSKSKTISKSVSK